MPLAVKHKNEVKFTKTTTSNVKVKKGEITVKIKSAVPATKSNASVTKKGVPVTKTKSAQIRVSNWRSVISPLSKAANDFKQLHWTKCRVIAAVLMILLCLMHIVSTASSVWLTHHAYTQGLWRMCYENGIGAGLECYRFKAIHHDYKWVQAFMTIAMVIHCLNVLYFGCMLRLRWTSIPLTISLEAAAMMTLVALTFFTACNIEFVKQTSIMFGWSYFIAWVTILIAVVTGIILFHEDNKVRRRTRDISLRLKDFVFTSGDPEEDTDARVEHRRRRFDIKQRCH